MLRPPRAFVIPLLLGLLLLPPGPTLAASPPEDGARRSGETVRSSRPPEATSIVVDLVDGDARAATELSDAEITVLEDGVPVVVREVEPLAGEGLEAWRSDPPGPPLAVPWDVVIYFDPVLLSPRSLTRAAERLASRANTLTALGWVEVVVADPKPEVRLGPTRDPKLVSAVLEDVSREPLAAADLMRHRDRVRQAVARSSEPGPPTARPDSLRTYLVGAVRSEEEVIDDRLTRLLGWSTGRPDGGRPGARTLLWVADGFDLEPARFYARGIDERQLRAEIRGDLAALGNGAAVARFAEWLARAGWTAIPVAPRLGAFGLAPQTELFVDPAEPLRLVAATTGGETVGLDGLDGALHRLGRRWRLAIDPSPEPGEGPGRLEVTVERPGIEILAPAIRPRSTAAGSALEPQLRRVRDLGTGVIDAAALDLADAEPVYLLPPEAPILTGRTSFTAQALDPAVSAVAFSLGARDLGIDRDPPFEVSADLPYIPATSTLRAVALDVNGAEIGRDEMEVNRVEGRFGVAIVEPDRLHGPGRYAVEVDVRTPVGAGPATVELSWDGAPVATLRHPPYRASLTIPEGAQSGFLHATATLGDGRSVEDVLSLGQEGFGSRIDVDLVELPAVVLDRRGNPVTDLGPDDVTVVEEGREQAIRSFATAAETPLTVALALDMSTSLDDKLSLAKAAATHFLREVLRPRDQGLLVAFAERPWLVAPLTREVEVLAAGVERLSMAGSTAFYDAVMLSVFQLRGVEGRKAVVVVTDGGDTSSAHSGHQSFEFARRSGIPVYVIAVWSLDHTERMRRLRLENRAQSTGGGLSIVRGVDRLATVYDEIARELRHQYLLTYESDRADSAAGWRRVQVSVRRPGLRVKSMGGYYAEP